MNSSRDPIRTRRTQSIALAILGAVLLAACSSGNGSADGSACEPVEQPVRSTEAPVGVLLPSGGFEGQSYPTAQAVADAGLNAVSIGWPFYFLESGDITYGYRDETKEQWLERLRCTVVDIKEAGLVALVWGQLVQADLPRGVEPMGIPPELIDSVGTAVEGLIAEVGVVLEELQVEYWSPVSELDKFLGYEGHQKFFARYVEEARSVFSGTVYAQPNSLDQNGFTVNRITPDFGGVDAMSIAWISFACREDDMQKVDWLIEQAEAQGITRRFIGEIGGVTGGTAADRPCMEMLISRWGSESGVVVLDAPSDMPNASQVAGGWLEELLLDLR
jgi:hypothetical protein